MKSKLIYCVLCFVLKTVVVSFEYEEYWDNQTETDNFTTPFPFIFLTEVHYGGVNHLDQSMNLTMLGDLLEYDPVYYNKDMFEKSLSVIKNSLQRDIVSIQRRYCPFVPLCNASKLAEIRNPILFKSCCTTCSCDLENCHKTRTCCPDILDPWYFNTGKQHSENESSSNQKTQANIPLECISLYLREPGENYAFALAECPVNSQHDREKCSREYNSSTPLQDRIPVYGKITYEVFRNRFCAYCNGYIEDEINYLQASLKCQGFQNINEILNSEEIVEYVYAHQNCNIVFKIPNEAPDFLEYCSYAINKCNSTGQWKTGSKEIETACKSYRSLVTYMDSKYQNIFCLVCNGLDASNFDVECPFFRDNDVNIPFSFSGLLKIERTREPMRTGEVCPGNGIYYTEKAECLQPICPSYLMLNEGQCTFMFDDLQAVRYNIYLRLYPTLSEEYKETDIYDIIGVILSFLFKYDAFIVSQEVFCTVSSPHSSPNTIKNAVLQYCDLNLITQNFYDNYNHSFVRYILSLNGKYILADAVFELTDKGGPFFRIEILPEPDIFKKNITDFVTKLKNNGDHTLFVINTMQLSVLPFSLEQFELGQQLTFIEISSPLICPAVNLSTQDVLVTQKIDGSIVIDNRLYLNVSEAFIHNGRVYICADVFEIYLRQKKTHTSLGIDIILSIVCTSISILALILTILSYLIHVKLRRTLPGMNVMALCISLLLAQSLYLVSNFADFKPGTRSCEVVGVLVHFAWLLTVFWMNICTYHMFRTLTRTKQISNSSGRRRFILYNIYTVFCSATFIGITVVVSSQLSDTLGYGEQSCYISSQTLLYFTFALPVVVVVVSNLLMFIVVVVKIARSPSVTRYLQNDRSDIAVFAKLSTLTGITWLFGFMYTWTDVVAFSYVFIVLNASQGMFLLVAFVTNKRVLNMYRELVTKSSASSSIGKSPLSTQTTLSAP